MSKFSAVFAIIFSCLLINVNSAGTLAVSSTDGASATVYPVSVTKTGQTAVSVTATPSTTVTAPTDGAVVANIYTARWTNGLPLQQSWTLTADSAAGTVAAIGATVAITTGPQVSLTVTNTPPATVTAGTAQANAAAVLPTTTTNCGNYFIDCISGTITIQLYVPATVNAACVVSITQVAAIAGILQYTTASVPTTTTVATAVTAANAATGAATTICGTATSGTTNTLYYFISTFGSATGTAQTTAFNNVRTAATAGNLAGNTAYSVSNLQPTIVGTVNAPSASASSLSTISKSANKLVVFAGVLTTMVATLFGFAF